MREVVLIPRPVRDHCNQTNAQRPRGLKSIALKMLVKWVDYYLKEDTLRSKEISPAQHVYQVGKLFKTTLHDFIRGLERALDTDRSTLSVSLHMRDNTPTERMSRAVRSFAVRNTVTRWTGNLLTNRTVLAQLGGKVAQP